MIAAKDRQITLTKEYGYPDNITPRSRNWHAWARDPLRLRLTLYVGPRAGELLRLLRLSQDKLGYMPVVRRHVQRKTETSRKVTMWFTASFKTTTDAVLVRMHFDINA